jgi:hypothetical protein
VANPIIWQGFSLQFQPENACFGDYPGIPQKWHSSCICFGKFRALILECGVIE